MLMPLAPRRFFFCLALIISVLHPILGSTQEFQAARPGYVFQFPRDHGAHPEFKTEWWYYTGHLKSTEGQSFGYQLTFFRAALAPTHPKTRSAWAASTLYFAHLALTDPARRTFTFREKAMRGAMGLAGAETGRLKVWVDDWLAEAKGDEHILKAKSGGLGLDLTLTPLKPPVLHGEAGLSRKSAATGAGSHYYSITRLSTSGEIQVNGRTIPVTGTSWLDREFATSQLAPDQAGWDWFALQLSDGADLMLYLMRRKDGSLDPASSGTLVDPQGQARHLTLSDFTVTASGRWKSPHSGAFYPAGWQLKIPAHQLNLNLTPALPDQELRTTGSTQITYWEGQVNVLGKKESQTITGRGYVELTGYAGPLGGRF